ncbi:Hpt domain-containing protein, partial [Marinicella sp. S1101]
MSNIEQIDFSTLTWVKTELDETLNRAKDALKAYVEDSEDTNQLQFCVTYLHQIQGTLKMVELYGAAMVAEEMELVAKDLIEGSINDVDSAYDVLMQSILQLPDYLERIELGHKDVPIVLLPLVNDLRSVRSKNLLSESALFNPNLDLGVPEKVLENDISLKGNQLKTALLKIRSIYEISLLNWFKNPDSDKGLKNMQLVISKLQMILSPEYLKQLFWAYSGLVEGLISKNIDDSVSVKQLAGQVDHLLKDLIENQPQTKSSSRAITRNMLYYIGINEDGGSVGSNIKSFFNLSQFIPDQGDIEHAEGSLTGKNKELLQTVSEAINDDVLVVQESLDLFIRNKSADVGELSPLLDNLQKIADTLGILGLGVARDSVISHQDQLKANVDAGERPSDDGLLDVAKTLLMIESQLGDHIQSLGITDDSASDDENAIPKSEQKVILQTLAKESIVNLQQIKTNFVAFIESPWDKHQVEDNPKLLNEIAGAMKILNLTDAGAHVDDIIKYVNTDILGAESKPSALQLEQLATVISSLEYYLENLDQGQRIRENLLSEVGVQIKALVHQASQDIEHNKELAAQKEADDVAMPEQAEDTGDHAAEDLATDDAPTEHAVDETEQSDAVIDETEAESEPEKVEDESNEHAGLVVEFGDDVDDEIKEVFLEEFEEELANMQAGHAQWHENPDDNEDKLTEIRRIFHTLKGSGRLVGAEAIGEFGWQLENMCNRFLDGGVKNTNNFKTVLESGVSMAAVLYQALQDHSVVPNDYDLLLQNAENVANEKPLQEAAPVTEVIESPAEVEDSPITEEAEELPELDAAEAETLELLDDSEVDESDESETEVEPEVNEESHEEQDSEDDVVADEAEEEEDLSLDYVQYDVEELKEQQQAESSNDSTADEGSDEEDSSDGFTLDDTDIEFDMEDFNLSADDTEQEDVQVSAEQDNGSENETVNVVDLDEDEVMDLEAELAELDDEEVIDLEAELAEMDDDISIDLDANHDMDADESVTTEQDDNEILLELADSDDDEDGLTLDIDDISFDDDEEVDEADSENVEAASDAEVDLPALDGSVNDDDLGVDPVFIEILQKEVGSHLTDMSQFVSDCMEKDQPKVNDDFVRVVHTLNGAASMASVDGITQMTTPLEKMSIILLDKKEPLNEEDLNHIEGVIKQAKSQLNLLGTGDAPFDESIGQYFVSRIEGLREEAAKIKDAEDLAVANNLIDEDVAELDLSDIEDIELDVLEEATAEEATAEEATAEEATAEEETAEEETAE